MAVEVTVELLTGTYEAGDVADAAGPEWPPHPARLFCALVSAARTPAERAALEWLEAQDPPVVQAAAKAEPEVRSVYVVTNAVVQAGKSQFHLGRRNGLRERARAVPAQPTVRFCWEAADPPEGVVDALDAAARRVPYLGRSTGVALVSATVGTAGLAEAPGLVVFEPCVLDDAQVSLRVPYSGYLAALDDLYEAGVPAHEVSRLRGYRERVRPEATAHVSGPPEPSAYTDFVVFRLDGLRAEGRLAPLFTAALRRSVLGCAGDEAPAVLHGHGADGRHHVAFLALPDVGQPHASGRLLGMAVGVPDLPKDERRAVLAAVLGLRRSVEGDATLTVPGVGEVSLRYEPGLIRPWGAAPRRWRMGSRRWVSATPVILDRYPKQPDAVVAEVVRSCQTVGLLTPVDVQVSHEPLMAGGVRLRPADLPPKLRGRLFRHVALTFERPVAGPMLVGAGRYLGIGLLAPIPDRVVPATGQADR